MTLCSSFPLFPDKIVASSLLRNARPTNLQPFYCLPAVFLGCFGLGLSLFFRHLPSLLFFAGFLLRDSPLFFGLVLSFPSASFISVAFFLLSNRFLSLSFFVCFSFLPSLPCLVFLVFLPRKKKPILVVVYDVDD